MISGWFYLWRYLDKSGDEQSELMFKFRRGDAYKSIWGYRHFNGDWRFYTQTPLQTYSSVFSSAKRRSKDYVRYSLSEICLLHPDMASHLIKPIGYAYSLFKKKISDEKEYVE